MKNKSITAMLAEQEYFKTDFITDRFTTDFYLPGTKVLTFTPTGANTIKLTNYYITKVQFSIGEKYPLYTIKRYELNEHDHLSDVSYTMVSHSMITVPKTVTLSTANIGTYTLTNDKLKDVEYTDALSILSNNEFLWLEQFVCTSLDICNFDKPTKRMITSINIDSDFNIYYILNKDDNTFYTSNELYPILIKRKDNETDEVEVVLNLLKIIKG